MRRDPTSQLARQDSHSSCNRGAAPHPSGNRQPSSCSTPFRLASCLDLVGRPALEYPSIRLARRTRSMNEYSPPLRCYLVTGPSGNASRALGDSLRAFAPLRRLTFLGEAVFPVCRAHKHLILGSGQHRSPILQFEQGRSSRDDRFLGKGSCGSVSFSFGLCISDHLQSICGLKTKEHQMTGL